VNLAIATMHRARHRLPRAQVGRVKMSLLLVMVLAYSPVATQWLTGPRRPAKRLRPASRPFVVTSAQLRCRQ